MNPTKEEAVKNCIDYFGGDELAGSVCANKYLLRDRDGNFMESNPVDIFKRVGAEFARIEALYPNPLSYEEILASLNGFKKIIPQGSPLAGIGNNYQVTSLSNCFLLKSPRDSYSGIMRTDEEIASVCKRRGGFGVNMSSLRPSGASVNNAAKTSDGVPCFMNRYSNSIKEIAQCIAKGQMVLTSAGLRKIEDVNIGDSVWTKIGWVRVINVLKNKKLITEMTTKKGYKIRTSKDHILLSTDENNIVEKIMGDFVSGDSVVLIPGERVEMPYVDLTIKEYERGDGGRFGNRLNRKVTLPIVLEEKLAYILGYSYGDGSVEYDKYGDPKLLSMACGHKYPQIENRIVSYCEDIFKITPTIKPGDGKLNKVEIHNKVIMSHLKNNGIMKGLSYEMVFPQKILNSGWKVQAAFIAGYFDADGYASGSKVGYSFASVNLSFLTCIKRILMSNGIITGYAVENREIKKWRNLHKINVTGGFFQSRFIDFLQGFSVKVNIKNYISSMDFCPTPYLAKNLNIQYNKFNYINGQERLSCSAYERYSSEFKKLPNILVLDQVLKIEELNISEDTYDLCLEEENLFWCEGFYVHNSGRRAAGMLILDCKHPDIIEFIKIKRDLTKVTGANISVMWHDDMISQIKSNGKYTLRFPVDASIEDAKYTKEVNAKEVWDLFVESNWLSAEPGYLNGERITSQSLSDCYADVGFKTMGTNPCGEIPLSENNSCILIAINLTGFINHPFTTEASMDWKEFIKQVRIGSRLIDDLIELEIEKIDKIIEKIKSDPEDEDLKRNELNLWIKIRENHTKGRRTGLGVTGFGDMLAMLGMKYASDEALRFTEALFSCFHEANMTETCNLAKERGAFPVWSWEKEKDCHYIKILPNTLQDEIKKYGRRNISTTTVAPAGSISMLAHTTSGLEPVFKRAYSRKRKMFKEEMEAGVKADSVDSDGIGFLHYEILHHGLQQWKLANPDKKIEESPYWKSEAGEIDWHYRVKIQGLIQKYVTHSLSSTVNLPKETTKEEISELYLLAHELGCKGITVYRDGSREGVMFEKKENKEAIVENHAPHRPLVLDCDIHFSSINRDNWVVFVGLMDGKPYEIFGGVAGNVDISKTTKTGKLIKNGRIDKIRRYDLDIPEKVFIKDIANVFSPNAGSYTRIISAMLRHGIPIRIICEQLMKVNKDSDMFSFEKSIARVLKKYIKDGERADGSCPDCGGEMKYENGCAQCIVCGNSKCS